jgi:hypothetical protein
MNACGEIEEEFLTAKAREGEEEPSFLRAHLIDRAAVYPACESMEQPAGEGRDGGRRIFVSYDKEIEKKWGKPFLFNAEFIIFILSVGCYQTFVAYLI